TGTGTSTTACDRARSRSARRREGGGSARESSRRVGSDPLRLLLARYRAIRARFTRHLASQQRIATAQDLGNQQFEVVTPGAMIADRRAQAVLAMQGRVGKHGDAVLLQLQHDLDVEGLQPILIQTARI